MTKSQIPNFKLPTLDSNTTRFAVGATTIFLIVILSACSLAEDITPPPGFESAPPAAQPVGGPTAIPNLPPDSGLGYPTVIPSVAKGAVIYSQNCTRCHGAGGAGDGAMASQIQFPMLDFTALESASAATPEKWFSIITNGNLERVMPPWNGSLTEEQRWHLVAYLYSLSATPDVLEAGKAQYDSNCAACHGEGGAGDGPEAIGAPPNFTDQQYMSAKANADFAAALGAGTAIENHNFADKIGDGGLIGVISYVRAFSYDSTPPDVLKGTVTGTVTNGTANGIVPADLTVTLHIFDNFQETATLATDVKSDGAFEFTGIEMPLDRALILSTEYGGAIYTSDVVAVGDQSSYDLPITIYDTTSDPSVLSISRMHIVFEFSEPGVAQVGELFVVNNTSDRTFDSATPDGPTTVFPLPPGYSNLSFQDGSIGDRYLQTDDGFADTATVHTGPDPRQILVSYKLPYADGLTFSQKLSYPAQTVNILLPEAGLTLTGDGITPDGTQSIQNSSFHSYTITGSQAGDAIAFEIKGTPKFAASTATTADAAASTTDTRSLLIGGLSIALAASVVAYWWTQRGGKAAPPRAAPRNAAARREELLREIAELDAGFEANEYPEAEYRREREKLKAELRRLIEQEKQAANSKQQK